MFLSNRQLQSQIEAANSRVSLNLDNYQSDSAVGHQKPPFIITVIISNAGPGVAESAQVGVRHLNRADLPAQTSRRNMGLKDVLTAAVSIDSVYWGDLPQADPKALLTVWVHYTDTLNNAFEATYDPASGLNSGLTVSPIVIRQASQSQIPPGS
jgi:hypothetical protein